MKLAVRMLAASTAWLVAFSGCGHYGQVNQGQVVEYRRTAGLITLISDSNYRDPAHPRFDVLPPVTILVPADSREMGPEPESGGLVAMDTRNGRATFFDAAAQSLQTINIAIVAELKEVRDGDPRLTSRRLPWADKDRKTITTYLPRERELVTFSAHEEYLNLPETTWKVGDEIRYYYKDAARALRLMNVSKTELGKAGE
jgi:hypothetical protein